MSNDLPFHSLTALARLLERGETSSRAIVEACLARIDALDRHLHAFVDVYRDDALAAADAADRERRTKVPRAARSRGCRSRSRTSSTSKAARPPPARRAGSAGSPITRQPPSNASSPPE